MMIRAFCASVVLLANSHAAASGPDKAAAAPPKEVAAAPAPVPALEVEVDGGLAMMSQSFHSNGDSRPGRLADYDFAAQGLGAQLAVRRAWMLGSVFRAGVSGFYRFAGLTGVSTQQGPQSVRLGLSSHQAAAGITAGAAMNALGGLVVDAHAAPAIVANYIETDARAPLPSDRTIGLLAGLRVAAPALALIGGRPLGLELDGSWMGLGQSDQTANLEDGADRSSTTFLGGGALTYGLATSLALTLGYHGSIQTTSYTGASVRNDAANGNATNGERVQSIHVAALGLRLQL
jgi:hypothetical protein